MQGWIRGFNTAVSYVEVKYVVASGNAGWPNYIITTLLQAKSTPQVYAIGCCLHKYVDESGGEM